MATSPPPPPDPSRNPFLSSSCGASSSSSSSKSPRPALRRSKTLANPESPASWRRDPLHDVTNQVLGREREFGRLQRIPLDTSPLTSRTFGTDLPASPTPSRIPRRALRRTRSAAPSFPEAGPSSSSPTTALAGPSALPADGLASPTRELRPRLARAMSGVVGSAAAVAGVARRTRSTSLGGGGGGGSSSSLAVPSLGAAAGPSRRRTFGGHDLGLTPVLEDPASEDAATAPSSSAAPTPTPTPRTRSRMRELDGSEGGGSPGGEGGGASENERRLRRRRSSGGSSTGSAPSTPSSGRRGLR